jgi:hypothetical protein
MIAFCMVFGDQTRTYLKLLLETGETLVFQAISIRDLP